MTNNNQALLSRVLNLCCPPNERELKKQNLTDANREKIIALKDKYKGKRCFIVGSSPSLNLLDLTKLNNEFVFTVNRGYMLKDKGLEHSTFHVISDKALTEDGEIIKEFPSDFSTINFVWANLDLQINNIENIYFDINMTENVSNYCFQQDLTKALYRYYTVIAYAIQISYYMGFSQIYLIGVDWDFENCKGHAYNETQGEKVRQTTVSIPTREIVLEGLKKYTQFLQSKNIQIFNASPKGAVDCMPRVKYEDLF